MILIILFIIITLITSKNNVKGDKLNEININSQSNNIYYSINNIQTNNYNVSIYNTTTNNINKIITNFKVKQKTITKLTILLSLINNTVQIALIEL